MDYPKLIRSNQKEESISTQRVNNIKGENYYLQYIVIKKNNCVVSFTYK